MNESMLWIFSNEYFMLVFKMISPKSNPFDKNNCDNELPYTYVYWFLSSASSSISPISWISWTKGIFRGEGANRGGGAHSPPRVRIFSWKGPEKEKNTSKICDFPHPLQTAKSWVRLCPEPIHLPPHPLHMFPGSPPPPPHKLSTGEGESKNVILALKTD